MADEFLIEAVDPRDPDAEALIASLSAELAARYDYADDGKGNFTPDDVLAPGGAFLVGRVHGRAVACGAFRPMAPGVAEIKRMFVEPDYRGRGFARRILTTLEGQARLAGYQTVRMETGTLQPEAIRLYESAGYHRIRNYGAYADKSRSVCFEKQLYDDIAATEVHIMPVISKILESALYVEDMDRSADFYQKLFGFPIISQGPRLIALGVPSQQVLLLFKRGASLFDAPGGPHDGSGETHVAFAIPASDYDAWGEILTKNDVTVTERRTWDRGGRSIYFCDLDGHLIELATPGVWSNY